VAFNHEHDGCEGCFGRAGVLAFGDGHDRHGGHGVDLWCSMTGAFAHHCMAGMAFVRMTGMMGALGPRPVDQHDGMTGAFSQG